MIKAESNHHQKAVEQVNFQAELLLWTRAQNYIPIEWPSWILVTNRDKTRNGAYGPNIHDKGIGDRSGKPR